MQKMKILAIGLMVAQIRDGAEVTVIVDNGVTYLPMFQVLGEGAAEEPAPAGKKRTAAPPVEETAPPKGRSPKKVEVAATEEPAELSEEEIGIELDALLEKIDGGKLTPEKGVTAIVKLTGAKTETVQEEVDNLLADKEADITETANAIIASTKVVAKPKRGAKAEPPAPAKTGRSAKKAAPKEEPEYDGPDGYDEIVEDWSTLAKGDKIVAFWGNDTENSQEYNAWYEGTVLSSRSGKVKVLWDDNTEELLIEGLHDEVRLAD